MAKAPKKPAASAAKPAPSEINAAGDGAGGVTPASATGGGGDAAQQPTAAAAGEGVTPTPEPAPPAAPDAAGADRWPAIQAALRSAYVAPAPDEGVNLAVLLLSNVDHDGVRLVEGIVVHLHPETARALIAAGAARMAD